MFLYISASMGVCGDIRGDLKKVWGAQGQDVVWRPHVYTGGRGTNVALSPFLSAHTESGGQG